MRPIDRKRLVTMIAAFDRRGKYQAPRQRLPPASPGRIPRYPYSPDRSTPAGGLP